MTLSPRDSPGLSPSSGRGDGAPPRPRPQPSDMQSCSLLTHTHVLPRTGPMFAHVCAHCGAVHTQEALTCALTCPARHKCSLPVLTPPHKQKHPVARAYITLPVHTESTSSASHTHPLHTAGQPSSYLAGGTLGWSSPNSSSLKRLLKRTDRGRPVLGSASSCRDTHR